MPHELGPTAVFCGVFLVALVLAGCGSSGSKPRASLAPTTSTAQTASATTTDSTTAPRPSSAATPSAPGTLDIPISSTVPLTPVPSAYTCDGNDISLPIGWRDLPAYTAEIDLFVVEAQPVGGKLIFDWAVAGLKPSLHGISAGRLPTTAIVGRDSSGRVGYSLCPPKGSEGRYWIALYALAHKIAVKPGFAAAALQARANAASPSAGVRRFSYKRA